jgi:hypothetical protein
MDIKVQAVLVTLAVIGSTGVTCLIIDLNKTIKRNNKAKELLVQLSKICQDAYTIEQCNNAWDKLVSECLDANGLFKIQPHYKSQFYELKALLIGKLSILNNK